MKRAIYALGLSLLAALPAAAQTSVAGDWEVTRPASAKARQPTFASGDMVGGYVFKGGDPNDPRNWVKAPPGAVSTQLGASAGQSASESQVPQ